MENTKVEDLATFDWLRKFGPQKYIFERLYNAKGSKEINITYGQNENYFIRIGNGKDDNLFYNKNNYVLKSFNNGLLYLQKECNFNNALILDKKGNVVFSFDNYNLYQRFNLRVPIKNIWEARYSRIECYDFFHEYEISQGVEFKYEYSSEPEKSIYTLKSVFLDCSNQKQKREENEIKLEDYVSNLSDDKKRNLISKDAILNGGYITVSDEEFKILKQLSDATGIFDMEKIIPDENIESNVENENDSSNSKSKDTSQKEQPKNKQISSANYKKNFIEESFFESFWFRVALIIIFIMVINKFFF